MQPADCPIDVELNRRAAASLYLTGKRIVLADGQHLIAPRRISPAW
jgi:hypothetical protein